MDQPNTEPLQPMTDTADATETLIRTVGARVREIRKAARLSRRELSERSGVSPRYLAQLEGGEGNISIRLLQRVALAMETPIETLFGGERSGATDLDLVTSLFQQADAATRARVMAILDPEGPRKEKSKRICLIGLRGAGKSTLGARVAREFGVRFIELNREIEKSADVPASEIFSLYGHEVYRQLEAKAIDRIIAENESVVLAVGGGIVSNKDTFAKVTARFHTVWVRAQPAEHMERVRAQGDLRPMAGNPQAMQQLREILHSREPDYAQADLQLDTSGKPLETSHAELAKLLLEHNLVAASR